MRKTIVASAVFAITILCLSAAVAGTLIPVVPFPNSVTTYAYGINNSNTIAGIYTRSDGSQHGFVGPLDGTGYSTFDFGAGGHTYAFALSDEGWVTGLDNTTNEQCQVFGCEYVRQPSGEPDEILRNGNGVDGITGQIVKNQKFVAEDWTVDEQEDVFESSYFGQASSYVKSLKFPIDSDRVRARGYGKHGDVVGYYLDAPNQRYAGFILHKKVVTSVNYKDAYYTMFQGINDKGIIVGAWQDKNGTTGQPFIYDSKKSAFKVIKIPGSTIAAARQVNDAGLVAIFADVGSFVYCSKKSSCPAARGTIEVAEKWVSADRVRWTPCKNGCVAPHPRDVRHVDPAKLHAILQQDKDLQLQLTSPYLR